MMRGAVMLLALVALAAGPGRAQQPSPPSDPNLAKGLFGEREPEPGDEEEAAGQAQPVDPAAQPVEPEAQPVEPEASPGPARSSEAYDNRVRQSYAAAESYQGPLDGGWIVSARGRDLLRLQLVDKGRGQVEGAWRDLLSGQGANASGLIDPVSTSGSGLDLSFAEPNGLKCRLTLHAASDGRLIGTLMRGDEMFGVALRRAP